MSAGQSRRVQVWAERQKPPGPDRRALAAIVLCAALPVLIGILLTSGSGQPDPRPTAAHPSAGHWVYVPSRSVAVHVDGDTKRVDATVEVGDAATGSPVVQDRDTAYLIDDDRVVLFGVDGSSAGEAPSAGVAEQPVTLEENGSAYLVYRQAGLTVRLGAKPVTTQTEGTLGTPVITPDGQLWTYQVDSGKLCLLTDKATLNCPTSVPAGHVGALAVLEGRPGFVDITAGTWQELEGAGEPVRLGESLPPNAAVAATGVGGRLAIVDPAERRLLLIAPGGDVVAVPLGDGTFGPPLSSGGAVAVVNADTGALTSYDGRGRKRAEFAVGGEVRLTTGADGRGYADSADGLQSVVLDTDGTLTAVHTTGEPPPSYQPQEPTPSATLPPATVAPTTTETVPPAPETVTETVTPTTTTTTIPPAGTPPPADTGTPRPPGGSDPPPAPPANRPKVDVLSAKSTGPGQATLEIKVSGPGPVFCHVFFNSVERAATKCEGTMTVVASGLAPNMTYDVYVLGTNAAGTGVPGKRAVLRT